MIFYFFYNDVLYMMYIYTHIHIYIAGFILYLFYCLFIFYLSFLLFLSVSYQLAVSLLSINSSAQYALNFLPAAISA